MTTSQRAQARHLVTMICRGYGSNTRLLTHGRTKIILRVDRYGALIDPTDALQHVVG
jgi:hypothetical protein